MKTYTRSITLFRRSFVLESDGTAITALRRGTGADSDPCPLLEDAVRQLHLYEAGKLTAFSLPLAPKGTAFQQRVWAALQEISYGKTRSYGELAALLGNPGAARAVGMACGRNPILFLIPCHRVIGKKGSLTGFAAGTELKEELLKLEHHFLIHSAPCHPGGMK